MAQIEARPLDSSVLAQIPTYADMNPMGAQEQALNIAGAGQRLQMGGLELAERRRQQKDEAQARTALKGVDPSSFEGMTRALSKIESPEIRMKVMAELQKQGKTQREATIQDMEIADRKLDILARALDPAIAQLELEARRPGMNQALLDAKTKQLVIPTVLQLQRDHPELADEVKRFLDDQNHLTYQGARSADAQAKWGSEAIKRRLEERKQETSERRESAYERDVASRATDRDRKAAEGAGALSPDAQKLKDELAARDPSFMARAGAKSIEQQNRIIEDWAKEGKTADDIIGSRQATKGTASEVSALYKQKAGLERTEKSIVRAGGFLDQAEQAVQEVDLAKVKRLGKLETWVLEEITDPALQNYHTRITELRAEYAIVLSKGGQVTDAARTEAAHVVPDYMTPASFARVKQAIQQGVSASSRAVDDSIAEATRTRPSTPSATPTAKPSWAE